MYIYIYIYIHIMYTINTQIHVTITIAITIAITITIAIIITITIAIIITMAITIHMRDNEVIRHAKKAIAIRRTNKPVCFARGASSWLQSRPLNGKFRQAVRGKLL